MEYLLEDITVIDAATFLAGPGRRQSFPILGPTL